MQLTFLGTRGNIRIKTKRHRYHASLLIRHKKTTIIIDYGLDYLKHQLPHVDAIFITHAHPDHVGGLKKLINVPVYATHETWQVIKNYPIVNTQLVIPEKSISIGELLITAYSVEHAINAPAVGYRICDGSNTIFYVSDVVKIKKQKTALKNVNVYIGDGAIITRTLLVKKRNSTLIGHSPIIEQLRWCKKEKIPRMIITHCGTEIVSQDTEDNVLRNYLKELGNEFQTDVTLAYDGMKIII